MAIDAAERAGEIIREVWKSGKLDIKEKGVDDPFTEADVKSQQVLSPVSLRDFQLIMGLLTKRWPKLAVVGEVGTVLVINRSGGLRHPYHGGDATAEQGGSVQGSRELSVRFYWRSVRVHRSFGRHQGVHCWKFGRCHVSRWNWIQGSHGLSHFSRERLLRGSCFSPSWGREEPSGG